MNRDSLIGTYTVQASADNKIIGSLLFVVQESDNSSSIQNQIPLETVLTLEMTSNQDSIRVFPKYVNSIGNELSFTSDRDANFIKIYIDNQYIISVKPNQWSDDITIGYGSFDVHATSPEIIITNTGETYFPATSNGQSINLSTPSSQDSTNLIIIGVIVAIVGGVAAAAIATFSIKKKKKSPTIQRTQTDDTQVWR